MKLARVAPIRYIMPNSSIEFEEAQRYPKLKGLTVENWDKLVRTGRVIDATPEVLVSIGNSTANTIEDAKQNIGQLEGHKIERVESQLGNGTIEYPIVLSDGGEMDLLSGNTRLTTLVSRGITPKILVIEV